MNAPDAAAEMSKSTRFTLSQGGIFGGGTTASSPGGRFSFAASAIGESAVIATSNEPSVAGDFQAFAGYAATLSLTGSGTILFQEHDIQMIGARERPLGAEIADSVWQRDNDPLFYWSTYGNGVNVTGYSFALDAIPDQLIDTTQTSYQYADNSIADGQHTFTVMAQNSAGNWGNPGTFRLWVDTVPPTTSALQPGNGDMLTVNQPTISALLSDTASGVDVAAARMYLNNSAVNATYDADTRSFSYVPSSTLFEGVTTVRIEAADHVGNAMLPLVWSFMVDTVNPTGVVVINARFAGDYEGEADTSTIYVTLTLEGQDTTSGVVSMRVWNDGAVEPADWQPFQGMLIDWPLQPVDGERAVYVRVRDAAGNESMLASDAIQLAIDAPDTWITSGPSGQVWDPDATFAFQSSEPGAVYQYRFDDDPWPETWTSENTVTQSGLSDGNHYFTVKSAVDSDTSGVIEPDEEDPTPAQRTWTIGEAGQEGELAKPEQPVKFWRQE